MPATWLATVADAGMLRAAASAPSRASATSRSRTESRNARGQRRDYVPGEARQARVGAALSNFIGLGGHNATVILQAV